MGYNVNDVLELIKSKKVEFVDMRFCDLLGTWQHTSFPASEIDASVFEDGLGFDGSSVRIWQDINNSDMLIVPDPSTAVLDPFTSHNTLNIFCDILDAVKKDPYERDPRGTAKKLKHI